MALQKRIGVFGILPYAPGEKIATDFEDAGLRWLFDEAAPGSIASYFRDTTAGFVDISSSEVFGWLVAENAGLSNAVAGPDRGMAAQAACDFVRSTGAKVDSFDALVFFIGGRSVGAGATSVRVDNRWIPTALLDDRGQHNFFCHEVGHIIGMDHSFRPSWTNPVAGLLFGEYGDATDIMSARTFGGHPVTFKLPHDPKSGINANNAMWAEAGPGVSPATVWRYSASFPNAEPFVKILPAGSGPTKVNLMTPSRAGTQLVALPFKNGGGFFTVEYRSNVGWDQGLQEDLSDPSNAPGLVVHSIRDIGTPADGSTWPRQQRVCYEATVAVPSIGDDDWDNGQFAIRVEHAEEDYVNVLIGEVLPNTPAVRTDVTVTNGDETLRPAGQFELILVGPNCGKQMYEMDFASNEATVTATGAVTGANSPEFLFSANGTQLGTWSAVSAAPQGFSVGFPVQLAVPDGPYSGKTETRTIYVQGVIEGNRMKMTCPAGDGRYVLDVVVTARTPSGQMVSNQSVSVSTLRMVIPEAAREAQRQCANFLTEKGKQQRDPREIDPLGPIVSLPEDGDWSRIDPKILSDAFTRLQELEEVNPRMARDLNARVADKLKVHTDEISKVAQAIKQYQR